LWAALAVLLFWALGAHRRLSGLARSLGQAWLRVQDALAQRAPAGTLLVSALREPLAAEQGALDALMHAQAQAERAAGAIASRAAPHQAAAWVAAEAALAAAASRVLALLEQQPALATQEPVAGPLGAWREAQDRLPFARQFYNDAADAYNAALAEFPTRLLARLFGLRGSGRV
jgi:LemA protein